MSLLAAALLLAALSGQDATAPSADEVFAESCVAVAGDRAALRVLAENRGWARTSLPDGEDFTRTTWADAYAAGENTIFLAAYPASVPDPARAVNMIYPAGTFCGVRGERPAAWRDSLQALAEDRLGMTRIRPVVRRDPDGDFQTAAWRREGGWIDVQYRRAEDPPFRVVWVQSGSASGQ